MKTKSILLLTLIFCLSLFFGTCVFANGSNVAQIGEDLYPTLADALAAVESGDTITLLANAEGGFDVGNSAGTAPQNFTIDMNDYAIDMVVGVGSKNTKTNGIRVLANSQLTLKNGTINATGEKIKVVIANYGTVTLEDVTVNSGANTLYTINNRGELTLTGETEVVSSLSGDKIAITNDPYNAVYSDKNATLNIADENVTVGKVQVELYGNKKNAGVPELNISAGTIEQVVDDGSTAIGLVGNITGGSFTEAVDEKFCDTCYEAELNEETGLYEIKEQPAVAKIGDVEYSSFARALEAVKDGETITLLANAEGGFDVGNSAGTAPQNFTIDMNNFAIDMVVGVGSKNTETNGIRVLANSQLTLKNGTINATGEKIKVVIANYGTVTLEDVIVNSGANTLYTINNRGELTLTGETEVVSSLAGDKIAITNDPYDAVYSDKNATLNIADENVTVGKVQVELYGNKKNAGVPELNISAGTIEQVVDDGSTAIGLVGNITGGSYSNPVDAKFLNENNLVELKDGDTSNAAPYTYHKTVADAMAQSDENDTVTDLAETEEVKFTVVLDYDYDNKKQEIIVTENEKITLPSATRGLYIFNGWMLDNELSEANTEITVTEDMTFVASWTRRATSTGGSSSSPSQYRITVRQTTGGEISPETLKVKKGEDQTFEIIPSEGYEIVDVLIDGESVGVVEEYTFENVKETHKIEAKFASIEEETWENPFKDVLEKDWYYDAVKFVSENKLFNGVANDEFAPNQEITRGMIVTVLYRHAKAEDTEASTYSDVDSKMYYSAPIAWAAKNGIVNGMGDNLFAPDQEITREQLATILHRYAKFIEKDVSSGENTNILSYNDFDEISEYAIPALQWTCGDGIMTGRTATTLNPKDTASRAEVATMLMRFCK